MAFITDTPRGSFMLFKQDFLLKVICVFIYLFRSLAPSGSSGAWAGEEVPRPGCSPGCLLGHLLLGHIPHTRPTAAVPPDPSLLPLVFLSIILLPKAARSGFLKCGSDHDTASKPSLTPIPFQTNAQHEAVFKVLQDQTWLATPLGLPSSFRHPMAKLDHRLSS